MPRHVDDRSRSPPPCSHAVVTTHTKGYAVTMTETPTPGGVVKIKTTNDSEATTTTTRTNAACGKPETITTPSYRLLVEPHSRGGGPKGKFLKK